MALVWVAGTAAAAGSASVSALEAAAERGDAEAQMQLASRYERAEGVARSFFRSNYLYCLAAERGHAEAQFRLGKIYANGRGVARDPAIAAELFGRAAKQGHDEARKLLEYLRDHVPLRTVANLPPCIQGEPAVELRLSRDVSETKKNAAAAKSQPHGQTPVKATP